MATTASAAHPVRLLSEATLDAIHARALGAWRAWSEEWGIDPAAATATCRAAVEHDQAAFLHAADEESAPASLPMALSPRLLEWVAERLFAPEPGRSPQRTALSPVAGEVARTALSALTHRVARALAPARSTAVSPKDVAFGRYRGTALVALQLDGLPDAVRLAVPPGERPPSRHGVRATGTKPLGQAMNDVPVRVSLVIGELSMSLGDLAQLGPGDVLRLPTRIDRPLQLRMDDGTVPACAFVGTRDHRLAVRLMPGGHAHA